MPPLVHEMESDSDFLLGQPVLEATREELFSLARFQRMTRIYLALHLLLFEVLPWIAILLLPRSLLLGKMENQWGGDGDALRFLLSFILGPAMTFAAGSIAVCSLAFVPFIRSKMIGNTFSFFSLPQNIYRSISICSALQCGCAGLVWSALTLFLCWSEDRYGDSRAKDEGASTITRIIVDPAMRLFFNAAYVTNNKHQEFTMFGSFWIANQAILQKILWMSAKAECLVLQYSFLVEVLRACVTKEIVLLEEEIQDLMEEALDDMLGTTCPMKSHPDPLSLHHSVQTFPDDEIPEEFVCPISKQVCLQPTIAVSGFTYDLPNIVRWICQQSDDIDNDSEPKDPITREPISFNDLYPNLALRKSILRWNNDIISKGQDSNAFRERHMQKEE